MKHSENIDQISLALNTVQAEVKDLIKDTKAYNYKYATLDQLLDNNRPIWTKYELSIIQMPLRTQSPDTEVILETTILHTSGQWITSEMSIGIEKGKMSLAQAAGCAITYARRYALSAILGIASTEDTDGADPYQNYSKTSYSNQYKPSKTSSVATGKNLGQAAVQAMLDRIAVATDLHNLNNIYIECYQKAKDYDNKDKVIEAIKDAKNKRNQSLSNS